MLLKQTKIVASISDRRCDVDFIKQVFEAGMNVVRMNTAHARKAQGTPPLSHHRQRDVILASDGNIQHVPASGKKNGDLPV